MQGIPRRGAQWAPVGPSCAEELGGCMASPGTGGRLWVSLNHALEEAGESRFSAGPSVLLGRTQAAPVLSLGFKVLSLPCTPFAVVF